MDRTNPTAEEGEVAMVACDKLYIVVDAVDGMPLVFRTEEGARVFFFFDPAVFDKWKRQEVLPADVLPVLHPLRSAEQFGHCLQILQQRGLLPNLIVAGKDGRLLLGTPLSGPLPVQHMARA